MTDGTPQIVLFGGTGDLARRKLFPALAEIADQQDFQVVAVGRREHDDESFRKEIAESLPQEARRRFEDIGDRVFYHRGDVDRSGTFAALAERLDSLGNPAKTGRLFYLSLSPALFDDAVSGLADAGLLERQEKEAPAWRRVVVEKPFGHDLPSARALNGHLHRFLHEEQIYRIDHYLGKETVQNLIGLRFHNAIFEPLWNRHHVELVQITVAEDIGVESGRGGYYDDAGALRDVVQNHMLQLLALTAMEPPASLEPEGVREQKEAVLRGLRRPEAGEVSELCIRGRYGPGEIDGEPVRGYLEEEGVAPESCTETFVALRAEIANWRWNGVPFLLRHGKRMPKRFTEIQVQFRTPPVQLFNRPEGMSDAEFRRRLRDGSLCQTRPNRLVIRLQPDEGIRLSFGVKEPGAEMRMAPATLDFDYRERFGEEPSDAYERLLLDAIRGDPTLFLRSDEIESAWQYIDAVREGWNGSDAPPLLEYPAGSWGPEEAGRLFEGCEGGWSRG